MELVRDGLSLSAIMDLGRQMLGRRQVIPGIAEILEEVQVILAKPILDNEKSERRKKFCQC
jgi:urease gamma subunit